MFDIAKLDTRTRSESGTPMSILHPNTGAPILDSDAKPVTITLVGPNSAKSKAKTRELAMRRADMERRGIALDEDFFARERFEFLSAVTIAWTFDTMDGESFLCTPENVAKFWADDRWAWVQSQAWNFAQQNGNYLPL